MSVQVGMTLSVGDKIRLNKTALEAARNEPLLFPGCDQNTVFTCKSFNGRIIETDREGSFCHYINICWVERV